MLKNKNLLIVSLIAVVNALGYGMIIPILYSYSHRFGLNDFQNGMLFALFALCSFISTPIIGRMSDKYGRRPLLIISIAGTAVSFIMMAFAPSALFIFLSRALDGLTAGNLPVAAAVISDSTESHERAKGFGMLGGAFNFGFIFGPALSAVTVGISPSLPFLIAAVICIIAVIVTFFFLPETNKHIGQVQEGKLFDFAKLWHALWDPTVGVTFAITFTFALALFMFIYGFQPYSVKVLHLSPIQISALFTVFGVMGFLSQTLVGKITARIGLKRALGVSFFVMTAVFIGLFFTTAFIPYILFNVVLGFVNSTVNPMIQTILSREAEPHKQGEMQGINASFMNLGQIAGPILGGVVATYGLALPFLASAIIAFICFLLSFKVLKHKLDHKIA